VKFGSKMTLFRCKNVVIFGTKIEVKNWAKNGANLGILKKVDFRRAFFDFVHNLFILFGHF
jgi:hypothetical protein